MTKWKRNYALRSQTVPMSRFWDRKYFSAVNLQPPPHHLPPSIPCLLWFEQLLKPVFWVLFITQSGNCQEKPLLRSSVVLFLVSLVKFWEKSVRAELQEGVEC